MNKYKALPMHELSFKEQQECWDEILNMCNAPSKKYGIEVEITRDCAVKKGLTGIARPFNAVDIYNLIDDYHNGLFKKEYGLINLSEAFDFFHYIYKDGKRQISVMHSHITRFDFVQIMKLF